MRLGKNNGLIFLEKKNESSNNIYKYIKGGKCLEKTY